MWGTSPAIVAICLLAACGGGDGRSALAEPSDDAEAPSGSVANAIDINGEVTPLDAVLLEIDGDTDNHASFDLEAGNGTFVPVTNTAGISAPPAVFWLSTGETVTFRADLHSPGTDAFRLGTYAHTALGPNDPALEGRFFFDKGLAGRDLDGDGEVSDEELDDVVGGSLTLTGEAPTLALVFDAVTRGGVSVRGTFRGEFLIID